jgi:hypothetical protein
LLYNEGTKHIALKDWFRSILCIQKRGGFAMNAIEKYKNLYGKKVAVICTDGTVYRGFWSEWFSEEDNNWDEDMPQPWESILIDTVEGIPTEITEYEIEHIEPM